jgi:hypothetical protein
MASELEEVDEACGRLNDELVKMGLEFLQRNHFDIRPSPALRQKRRRVLDLRDSAIYRATSIAWHAGALYERRAAIRRHFQRDRVASLEATDGDPTPLLDHMRRQSFLLDDILFNAVSLFDYIAHLIGVLRFDGQGCVWSYLVKECRKTPCRLNAPALVLVVVEAEDRWLGRLDAFRDKVIHNEALAHSGHESFDMKSITMTWRVWMSDEWKSYVPALGLTGEQIEMEDAGVAIARTALESARGVIGALWETLPWAPSPWAKRPPGGGP